MTFSLSHRLLPAVLALILPATLVRAQSGQATIARIEQMPNQPNPYNVRDWKQVALQYDSFIYDVQKTGQYLPLCFLGPAGQNYPQNPSFRLHTYVGTNAPLGNEAINVLPSLVGASLAGIDKRNQFGRNWILMSRDFFNKSNGENIYLNNPGASSGNDWWYDLMPNVFFYQLYDLYPDMDGEADNQFTSVADRFLESVKAMGGSDTPWEPAYMNYRAWKFKSMQPNPNGVPEPEAAGAYAWVLYHAWKKTGNPEYLKGAEWSLEFLNNWNSNPSYELQLPYGIYAAAKMNAEIGARYDLEKMVNWSFNRGPLRGWGAIVGTWGGFDVSGLIGEANDAGNDYAFQLNGVQQAAALVPMVRYDKRFARAIGKWVLNLSNATRLFFPGFLPANMQDGSAWAQANDPQKIMGHEALRQNWQNISPFATGDAVQGGWAATNLSLYSTSSIGYLGCLVEKTNVDKILKLDLLKTDFFGDTAYPSYLLYNPYNIARTVQLDLGNNPTDVYETLSEQFLHLNASGAVTVTIPANQAMVVTYAPAGGSITYERNRMRINGVVVDYDQHAQPYTRAPRIKALAALKSTLEIGDSTTVFATVEDPDSGQLSFSWNAAEGTLSGNGAEVQYISSAAPGTPEIRLIVSDPQGNADTALLLLSVVPEINAAPHIAAVQKSAAFISPNGIIQLTCLATDPDNDLLTFNWSAAAGALNGSGSTVAWTAPASEGIFQINVQATDDEGLASQASTTVLVKNFNTTPGNIIADYPFNGNAQDVSGNQLHGQPNGALLVPGSNGAPQSAYFFNGGAQNILVPNHPLLNFQDGITVSCLFRPDALPAKETFLLSHGSWQNRWKISITPEKQLRWTVNSLNGISDLDIPQLLQTGTFYHVSATYDGSLLALYLNGELAAYKAFSGKIRTTTLPFLKGQMLPGQTEYNFKGVLDAVKIFDYALPPDAAAMLYQQAVTPAHEPDLASFGSLVCFPNPVSGMLHIQSDVAIQEQQTVVICDWSGRTILVRETAGNRIDLDVSHFKTGLYFVTVRSGSHWATGRFIKN
jgi:hypothetical protein